ncbi:hypothetical protein U9M48_018732 [Paspalum notatum var. saurae]|uniref:Uncharacterized protein n=1 Tax=Paspalum notatum var. saurae TaxID=547442 RepID=A0AAQ3TDH6_PASNO
MNRLTPIKLDQIHHRRNLSKSSDPPARPPDQNKCLYLHHTATSTRLLLPTVPLLDLKTSTHADGTAPAPPQWRRKAARSAARQHTESGAERAPAPETGAGAGASAAEATLASAATATRAAITAAETRAIAPSSGGSQRRGGV